MKSFTNYREAMKKFIILLSAVALFASCQEVIENPNQPEAAVSKVPMVLESVITKTVLADDGLSIHWETGDVFSVFDNLGNNEKFTTTDAGASARFEGSVLSTANDFYAMVPYRTTNTTFDYENRTLRTYLVTGQKGSINSFENKRMISVAKVDVENAKVSFTNICGLLKFTLSRNDVKEVKFTSKGGENLGRYVDVTFAADGSVASIEAVEDGNGSEITMTHNDGNFPTGTYYALALPNTHSEGLATTVTLADGSSLTIDNSAYLEIPRNQKVNLGTIDEGFAVLPANKTISAGASVNFATASYETAQLWSGEKYHDYAYAVEGRVGYPDYYMSFCTFNYVVSGKTPMPAPVKVLYLNNSTAMPTVSNVESADWNNVSSLFEFDENYVSVSPSETYRENDDNYIYSGEQCINSWIGANPSIYIAFKYESDLDKRTLVYLKNFKVEKQSGSGREVVYSMNETTLTLLNVYYTSSGFIWYKSPVANEAKNILRLASNGNSPEGKRPIGYAIAKIDLEPLDEPVCDTPTANSTSAAISHTYASAGQYPVVVVSKKGTKTFVCRASLNVVE